MSIYIPLIYGTIFLVSICGGVIAYCIADRYSPIVLNTHENLIINDTFLSNENNEEVNSDDIELIGDN